MRFSAAAVTACTVVGTSLLCCNVASGFAPSPSFVSRASSHVSSFEQIHAPNCGCPACSGVHGANCACPACSSLHQSSCTCAACTRTGRTMLFADTATDEEIPAEVEAMDGIASEDEAHNVERPARESLKKKSKGKPLSEFSVGDTVTATVKTITTYGAFMDIGAQTDGLLHISRLSNEYVKDVNEILTAGQELEVRIVKIDTDKNQVALTLLTKEQEEASADAASKRSSGGGRQQARRDDSAVLSKLQEKGWDEDKFVEGTVASTVTFGAFVRVDASQWNSEIEGEMDGLVHISALAPNRVEDVTSIVNVGDKVQVRCKGIEGGKVSLSMIKKEDERQPRGRGGPPPIEGAKDWKESLEKMQGTMPTFTNKPLVVDTRK